jgi:hypothetical protein
MGNIITDFSKFGINENKGGDFEYEVGQKVTVSPDKFPQGHRPTKGNKYTISERWYKEEDPEYIFNDPGNRYCLIEVPNLSLREGDITGVVNEGSIAGFAVDPNVQIAIMTVVPAMVAAMLGQTFADEIKEWLKENMEKVVTIIQKKKRNGAVMESIDADTQTAIMLAVPAIIGLAFGHTYKDEVKDWLRENRDKAKSFFKRFLKK